MTTGVSQAAISLSESTPANCFLLLYNPWWRGLGSLRVSLPPSKEGLLWAIGTLLFQDGDGHAKPQAAAQLSCMVS